MKFYKYLRCEGLKILGNFKKKQENYEWIITVIVIASVAVFIPFVTLLTRKKNEDYFKDNLLGVIREEAITVI